MYFNVNFNVFFKSIKVHLLVVNSTYVRTFSMCPFRLKAGSGSVINKRMKPIESDRVQAVSPHLRTRYTS